MKASNYPDVLQVTLFFLTRVKEAAPNGLKLSDQTSTEISCIILLKQSYTEHHIVISNLFQLAS